MPAFNFSPRNAIEREKLFISLYKSTFPALARYVSKMGGSFDQAKDVFQDALVIFYEKAIENSFQVQSSEKAYLFGIAKHLWLKTHQDNARHTPINGLDISYQEAAEVSERKILNFLERAGKKCMDLLRAFYYDQLPLADAAKLFGFSGVRSATVQKYKCLEKVRETVKEKALSYEDFID